MEEQARRSALLERTRCCQRLLESTVRIGLSSLSAQGTLFLPDLDHVRRLAGHYGSQQDFFKALESTYSSKLISEVRISVRARKVDGSLTFRELSEGEQQLLMVLGLLRFTREDESLFLLDEFSKLRCRQA